MNNSQINSSKVLGVVGGMGPLASAEFVKRVYQYFSFGTYEQNAPFIIQYSDPSIPDRTTQFLKGDKLSVYNRLIKALETLRMAGATKYVICCFTIHHIVPLLPEQYLGNIISLVDIIVENVLKTQEKYLFLSTTGTRKMKILEDHPKWSQIKEQIYFLSDKDQKIIHDIIYSHLKRAVDPLSVVDKIKDVINKYEITGIIAGCTEIHLLTTKDDGNIFSLFHPLHIVDPLDIIAQNPFDTCITENIKEHYAI